MSATLITGATGTVGHGIAERLIERGEQVRALVRSPGRARGLLSERIELVGGDVGDAESVRAAVDGCSTVFHAAGLPEQWRRDPADFTHVNVDGTRNLVEASLRAGVERFVYTSTIDVFTSEPEVEFDESALDPEPRPTHYERSKQEADRIVSAAIGRGLPAVFLHPSGVYGPAPVLSPGMNELIADLARRKIPMLLPGGMPVVHAADVAEGHLRAAVEAPVGARYILSESYHSLVELAEAVKGVEPRAKVPPVMPLGVARAVSSVGERVARVTGRPPLIPRGALHFLESRVHPLASRAREELGWAPIDFAGGLEGTLEQFRQKGWIGR